MLEAPSDRRRPLLRRALTFGVKVFGLACVVGFAVTHPALLKNSAQALLKTRLDWWLVGFIGFMGTQWVGAWRVRVLLEADGFRQSLWRLWVEMVQSVGWSAVVSGLGVVYRIERIFRRTGSIEHAAAAVLVDRLFAVAGLVGFGVLAYATSGQLHVTFGKAAERTALLIVIGGAVALMSMLLVRRFARSLWNRVAPLATVLRQPRVLALATLQCVVGYFFTVLSVYGLARGIGQTAPVVAYAYAVPLVTMATLIPISIGGLGVREAGYAVVLAPMGVTNASAIALGLAQYGTFLVAALLGVALFFWEKDAVPDMGGFLKGRSASSEKETPNDSAP